MAAKRQNITAASQVLVNRYYQGQTRERLARLKQNMADLALGDQIRLLRERAGLTQAQLARLVS
jgi:hypothetical protein